MNVSLPVDEAGRALMCKRVQYVDMMAVCSMWLKHGVQDGPGVCMGGASDKVGRYFLLC